MNIVIGDIDQRLIIEKCQGNEWFLNSVLCICSSSLLISTYSNRTNAKACRIHINAAMFMYSTEVFENDELRYEFYYVKVLL